MKFHSFLTTTEVFYEALALAGASTPSTFILPDPKIMCGIRMIDGIMNQLYTGLGQSGRSGVFVNRLKESKGGVEALEDVFSRMIRVMHGMLSFAPMFDGPSRSILFSYLAVIGDLVSELQYLSQARPYYKLWPSVIKGLFSMSPTILAEGKPALSDLVADSPICLRFSKSHPVLKSLRNVRSMLISLRLVNRSVLQNGEALLKTAVTLDHGLEEWLVGQIDPQKAGEVEEKLENGELSLIWSVRIQMLGYYKINRSTVIAEQPVLCSFPKSFHLVMESWKWDLNSLLDDVKTVTSRVANGGDWTQLEPGKPFSQAFYYDSEQSGEIMTNPTHPAIENSASLLAAVYAAVKIAVAMMVVARSQSEDLVSEVIEPRDYAADRAKGRLPAARKCFDVGKEIHHRIAGEYSVHFRSPHFGYRWKGVGRSQKVLVPIAGCVVNRKKFLQTPHGYESEETTDNGNTAASSDGGLSSSEPVDGGQ